MKMTKIFNTILAFILLPISIGFAFGQTQDEKKLEIKVQTGDFLTVRSLAFSPNGKILVSVNYKGTVNMWDVKSGRLIRTLTETELYLPYPVDSISFSPNGKYIVGNGSFLKTIQIWNTESGAKLNNFQNYFNHGCLLLFNPKSENVVTIFQDGKLRMWDSLNGKEIYSLPAIGKTDKPSYKGCSGAFSPDGKTFVTSREPNEISMFDVTTGNEIMKFIGHTSFVNSLAFTPDGKYLISGSADKTIRFWNIKSGEELNSIQTSSTRSDFAINPVDNILAICQEVRVKTIKIEDSKNSLLNKNISCNGAISFNPTGKIIATSFWEKNSKRRGIKFWDFMSETEWMTVISEKSHFLRWFQFSKNEKKILILNSFSYFIWNLETKELLRVEFSEQIKAEFSLENRTFPFSLSENFITNVVSENQVKILDRKTEKELVKIVFNDDEEWVIMTPDGRFDASEGALKLMHYAYGLEVIDLEQLKEMYYEPGLLQKILGYSKEPLRSIVPLKDIKLYPEIVSQTLDEKTGKLNIKLKNRGGGIGRTEVFVNGKRVVEDARDERLRKNPSVAFEAVVGLTVDLPKESFVKGKSNEIKVITSNYLKEIGRGNIQSRGSDIFYVNQEREELPNLYAIIGGVSDYEGDALDLRFAAKDAEDFSNALRLGANRLFCPSQGAECLGKIDIRTFSTARESAQEQPTKENFKKAFADIAAKAKAEDIVVIYLAGHGVTLGTGTDTYFYLTREARSASKEDLEKNFQTVAISNAELTDWLTPNNEKSDDIYIKANKQVIILDTCAAGNFAGESWKTDRDLSGDQIRAMDFLRGKTGTFILMGSAANRPSYEANRYNQGLLTRALLEGMKGLALQPATGNVDVALLFNYAQNRVPEIAKEMSLDQRPIIKTPSASAFVFGQIAEQDKSKIALPALKPMLLRPRLGSGEENDDPLNLVAELRKRFDAESSYETMKRSGKGEPVLIYIDDDSFPGAVRVTGTYTVEAEKVRIKSFLRKDGKTIATLPEIFTEKEKVVDELLNALRRELEKLK